MSENQLHLETSPYLLQHKDNPVHWRAWGKPALDEAKASGKPILLSVGYAACHWCHVMAHESFEDDETAALMNALFVNVKVDREERPDIDAIYMGALHQLGQQGGWPLTMFLDDDGQPFWGGTYFPKTPMYGQPAFQDVLRQVGQAYREQKDKVAHNAKALVGALTTARGGEGPELTDAMIEDLTARMVRAVDLEHGGINGAPKFPQWNFFWLLWRGAMRYRNSDAQAAVETTLTHICQGGIYDHLAGGFSRYSVDERWLAPHFEKMLYDNALLIDLMTEVWRETDSDLLKIRTAETVRWLQNEMVLEGGGFAASIDADSDAEEGKFYVWTQAEIHSVLGDEDAEFFSAWYDVTDGGNWEGKVILNRLSRLRMGSEEEESRLADLRKRLLDHREKRVRPGIDDKVLADWNGLMIAALARAARVFQKPEWTQLAERAFAFVCDAMTVNGELRHSYCKGVQQSAQIASDYANMIWAALRLHEATLKPDYLDWAKRWTEIVDRDFWAETAGGYTMTPKQSEDVIVRLRNAADDATPNANGRMVSNLMQLAMVTGDLKYQTRAQALVQAFAADVGANLISHSGFVAASFNVRGPQFIAVCSPSQGMAGADPDADLSSKLNRVSLPGAFEYVVDKTITDLPAGLADKTGEAVGTTAYCCIGQICAPPVQDPDQFVEVLRQTRNG